MDLQGVEIEKKYDVGLDAEVPALAELPGAKRVGEPRVDTLEAVYFDTHTHVLAARGITLRRRTGGADAGWHLKLAPEPATEEAPEGAPKGAPEEAKQSEDVAARAGQEPQRRREIHAPLGQPAVVPDSLMAHLMAYLRGNDVAPVVRLETRRTTYPLYGDDGVHLADLADDRVTSELLGEPEVPARQWREWELELVHGSAGLFPAAGEILAAAGARPAQHRSKLAKALALLGGHVGPLSPTGDAEPAAGSKSPGKKDPVSALLTAYLATQIHDILANDPGVRMEQPEALHDLRSASRRARSALAAYRRINNAATVQHLRDELKWLGQVLGTPRDADVMRDRLRSAAGGLPPGPASAAVKARLEDELTGSLDAAYRELQEALVSGRYYRLLDDLEAFRDHPPVRPEGAAPAGKAAAKVVAKAAKRLQRAAKTAKNARRGAEHETALHQVRKDAKRLRHVAESAAPVHRKRAEKIAKAAHRQQKILGEFHDSIVARDLLAKLATAPELPEDAASAFVTLHTRQVQLAADAEAKYWKARKKSRTVLQRGVI